MGKFQVFQGQFKFLTPRVDIHTPTLTPPIQGLNILRIKDQPFITSSKCILTVLQFQVTSGQVQIQLQKHAPHLLLLKRRLLLLN